MDPKTRLLNSIILKGQRAQVTSGGGKGVDLFAKLMWLEDKLKQSGMGWHEMSPFWKETLKRFLRGGKRRLALRVGRRGGKSSTLCRLAVVLLVFGNYDIPAGDTGEFIFMSVSKNEATSRLNTIRQILDIINVPHAGGKEVIQLKDMPRRCKVYPASAKFTVGMTCIGIMGDEVARWENDDNSANPARDIYGSVRPAMLTQPNAKELMSSSPWSELDYHYETVEQGDTEEQDVAIAPTWVANPSDNTTYEKCKKLEPDDETFEREYGAVPMRSGLSTFFDPVAVDLAMAMGAEGGRVAKQGEEVMAGADFAFTSDWSACSVFHKVGRLYVEADKIILKPERGLTLKPSETCEKFATLCKKHGVSGVMADAWYRESIVEELLKANLGFIDSPKSPHPSFVRMRALMNQERLSLVNDKDTARRLKEVQSRPTANGRVHIHKPRKKGSGHADDISAMVLAVFQRRGTKVAGEEEVVHMDEYEEALINRMKSDDPMYTETEFITYDN